MPAGKRQRPTRASQAVARRHAFHAAVCDEVEPWAHGTLVRTPSFAHWWDVTSVRVEGPAPPGLTAGDLVREADAWLAGFAHRKVELEEEATGRPLADGLRELGWTVERLVAMRRGGAPPGSPDPEEVGLLSPADADALNVEWLLEDEVMLDETAIRAYLGAVRAAEVRIPGELVDLGAPARGLVSLRVDGTRAEIESAYVTASARGAGRGTGLLEAAIARASRTGVEDLWIAADADGRPRELYERLGFRAEWTYWDCVRRPPAKSDAPRR